MAHDHAMGIWYVRWGFALLPILFGLLLHLLTLGVTAVFVRECIQQGRFRRISGMPLVGPICIDLGLWWSPSRIPVWIFLVPWGLEWLAIMVSIVVQKITQARPTSFQ